MTKKYRKVTECTGKIVSNGEDLFIERTDFERKPVPKIDILNPTKKEIDAWSEAYQHNRKGDIDFYYDLFPPEVDDEENKEKEYKFKIVVEVEEVE